MRSHYINKTTRRISWLTGFIVLLIVGIFMPVTVKASNPLTVALGTATAKVQGEKFVVNLELTNVAANLPRGINNSGFTIQYNNSAFELVSVARGSLILNPIDMAVSPSTSAEIMKNNGNIVLLHNDDSSGRRPISSDGIYAVLTFKSKSGAAAGSYPLTFKAGSSSIGQMNTAGTYPEDFDMASVVLNEGTIIIPGASQTNSQSVSSTASSSTPVASQSSTETVSASSSAATPQAAESGPVNSNNPTAAGSSAVTPRAAEPGLVITNNPTVAGIANAKMLNDIGRHWAQNYIQSLVALGILNGYPDASFKPDKTISRAEFANIITAALKLPDTETQTAFKDWGNTAAWARSGIASAAKAGIINGFADGTFQPDQAISRSQIAVIIIKALQKEVSIRGQTNFSDNAEIPSWALPYVQEAVKSGLVTGKGDNQFKPNDPATRAEAACILAKMLEQMKP